MRALIGLILIIACSGSLMSCVTEAPAELVLFDFESDAELDQLDWKCHTLFSLANENVTHGVNALRLEVYPSDYPGLVPKLIIHNWSRYQTFSFDIYNPGDERTSIAVRIDDRKEFPDYEDRYNKSFILEPGANHLTIPLNSLITSGTRRPLELTKISRFLIFMVSPQKKFVLYIDYIHLL